MFYYYFTKLKEGGIIHGINKFLYTPWYMLLVALIMAVANVFSLEFMSFYTYMGICIYVVLFAPDCFPIAPMCCCGYMLFSAGNNPAENYGNTLFSVDGNLEKFIAIAVTIGVFLIARLFFELFVIRRKRTHKPRLMWGFLALGAAYLISGIGTDGYGGKELAYAALQIVSLCATYFYLFYTVDWSKRKPGDAAAMLCAIGIGLLIEIVAMYFRPEVMDAIANSTFHRALLKTGWGVYNNVGGMMLMCMPAPFYFACAKKHTGIYLLLASVFFVGVVLTQSRGSMLVGAIIYLVCCGFTLFYLPKGKKWIAVFELIVIFLLGVAAIMILLYCQEKWDFVVLSFEVGITDDSGRFNIYAFGFKQFLEAPLFGTGFYATVKNVFQHGMNNIPDDFFIPPRYHNTIIQLLATGGIVALLAYIFHRLQTIKIFFHKPSKQKTFLGLAIAAHLIASLLDCNFFNLGPGLTYGIILLCAEMIPQKRKKKPGELPPLRRKPTQNGNVVRTHNQPNARPVKGWIYQDGTWKFIQ